MTRKIFPESNSSGKTRKKSKNSSSVRFTRNSSDNMITPSENMDTLITTSFVAPSKSLVNWDVKDFEQKNANCKISEVSKKKHSGSRSEKDDTKSIFSSSNNQSVITYQYEEKTPFLNLCTTSINHFLVSNNKQPVNYQKSSNIDTKEPPAIVVTTKPTHEKKIRRRKSSKLRDLLKLDALRVSKTYDKSAKDFKLDELRVFVKDIIQTTRILGGDVGGGKGGVSKEPVEEKPPVVVETFEEKV